MTLSGDAFYMDPGKNTFEKKEESPLSRLFEYEDKACNIWRSYDNGLGIYYENMPEKLKAWFEPFSDFNVQAMLVEDGLVWIGDNVQLVRFNMEQSLATQRDLPQLYVRHFSMENGDLTLSFSNDKTDPIGQTLYSYRMHADNAWSKWDDEQEYLFANLGYGSYQVSVRSKDAFGQLSEIGPLDFKKPYPVFVRWYSLLLYLIIIVFLVYLLFRYRMRRMAEEQQRLEAIVDERTKELRKAQDKLLRQERAAAIGKLTKPYPEPHELHQQFCPSYLGPVRGIAAER